MTPKNAFYAQSGGVSAVINASACGLLQAARQYPEKIGKVYAGRNGIIGALTEDLVDTSLESEAAIDALKHSPGAAFGSCRYKLKSIDDHRAQYERLIEVFRAHDIGYFFYNGGGDSQDTAYKVSQIGAALAYPIVCVGIPKTVDNDLAITDCSPGFGSAAKYIATSIREAAFDLAAMSPTSTQVFVLEVMGRHAGWATAACALAAEEEGGAPHILLLPEVAFDQGRFLAKVEECLQLYGHCVIAVSEGVKGPGGEFLSATGVKDAFGHAQLGGVAPVIANLISANLGRKCHWAVPDYLMRSARHIASETDVQQAYAVGRSAVECAIAGKSAVMPAIRRLSDAPYRWDVIEAPLSEVANREKLVPPDFISADGFGITEAARRYLAPLIMGEAYPPFKSGLPDYVKLQNAVTPKKLTTAFAV
ncbi:6-phosphofructokinase [Bradyrhizobium liaoningense]|uniref:6-phosphofructokinase n=1 Tax=Bradyrhizobium liaoningense TaxID=43992 RepID=UPI001BAA89BC|nr:6-phosphofructokinase [Bradyrhizobium liaoningense]MBR0740360.1 6-phosphofructokinase [Bradyrhizobium liaoningense]